MKNPAGPTNRSYLILPFKMQLDKQIAEEIMQGLKVHPKFRLIRNKQSRGFWGSGGTQWDDYTEVESENIRAILVEDMLMGSCIGRDLTVIDKARNACVYSNAPEAKEFGLIDKVVSRKKH